MLVDHDYLTKAKAVSPHDFACDRRSEREMCRNVLNTPWYLLVRRSLECVFRPSSHRSCARVERVLFCQTPRMAWYFRLIRNLDVQGERRRHRVTWAWADATRPWCWLSAALMIIRVILCGFPHIIVYTVKTGPRGYYFCSACRPYLQRHPFSESFLAFSTALEA